MTTESFTNIAQLELLLKKPAGSLVGDAYTLMIVSAAETLIRDTAGQPGWVGADPGPGQSLAPDRARFISLWLSARAWSNPTNQETLQRRTAGPISDTYFQPEVSGLELTDAETSWLEGQSPSSGLWVQPVGSQVASTAVYLPDPWPGSTDIYMDDGTWAQAYGGTT